MLAGVNCTALSGCGMAGVHCGTRPWLSVLRLALRRLRRGAPSKRRAPLAACRVKRAPLRAVWKLSASQSAVLT
ncbi:hypothetical protein D3C85_1414490 [compost metagenome]